VLDSFICHGLSKDEASEEALLQVVAGSDTSATPIRIIMLNLLTDPKVHACFIAEIKRPST